MRPWRRGVALCQLVQLSVAGLVVSVSFEALAVTPVSEGIEK